MLVKEKRKYMATITIDVTDKSVLNGLKKILKAMNGVRIIQPSISRTANNKKTGYQKAIEDLENGRVSIYNNVEELIKDLDL